MRTCTAALVLLLTACGSTPPAPPLMFYRLQPPPAAAGAALRGELLVEAVDAYGVYSERPLLYRRSALGLEQYRYALWAEPPTVMLHHLLVAHLRSALGQRAVLTADPRLQRDYALHTRVLRMEHLLASNAAALTLEFTLSDAAGQVVYVQTFARERKLAAASVADYLKALEALVGDALASLPEPLRRLGAATAR